MIAVTAASGQLGRLVVAGLLEDAGIAPAATRAIVRDPDRAAALAARGVDVRRADYDDPAALGRALEGVDRLLLISGSEVGRRVEQHGNVLRAARDAGVGLVAYTSGPKADASPLPIAEEHRGTERLLAELGLPAVVLRHNWYLENYDIAIRQGAATGQIIGSAGDGRIAAATRADLAAGDVAALTADEPVLGTFELGGDEAWTLADLAAAVAAEAGRDVVYRDLTPADHEAALVAAGLPAEVARLLVAYDQGIARGALDTGSRALSGLIGRPTTTLVQHVRRVLGAPPD